MNFWAARNSASALPPSPLVLDDLARGARRAGRGVLDLGPGRRRPTCRLDARSASVAGLHRLLLGRHDALERRVAGLAGLVGHRHHRRQRGRRSTSVAVSPSRRLRTGRPRLDDSEASVTCGSPAARPASPGPRPSRRRSRPCRRSPGRTSRPFSIALASTSEVPIASVPCDRVVDTWTPLSAPIGSALRSASSASSGPTVSDGDLRRRRRRPSRSAAPARRRTRRARTADRRRRHGRRSGHRRSAGRVASGTYFSNDSCNCIVGPFGARRRLLAGHQDPEPRPGCDPSRVRRITPPASTGRAADPAGVAPAGVDRWSGVSGRAVDRQLGRVHEVAAGEGRRGRCRRVGHLRADHGEPDVPDAGGAARRPAGWCSSGRGSATPKWPGARPAPRRAVGRRLDLVVTGRGAAARHHRCCSG